MSSLKQLARVPSVNRPDEIDQFLRLRPKKDTCLFAECITDTRARTEFAEAELIEEKLSIFTFMSINEKHFIKCLFSFDILPFLLLNRRVKSKMALQAPGEEGGNSLYGLYRHV